MNGEKKFYLCFQTIWIFIIKVPETTFLSSDIKIESKHLHLGEIVGQGKLAENKSLTYCKGSLH